MAIFRGDGGSGDATTDAYASQVAQDAQTATTKANEAAASATAAASSASAASTSESNASTSETNAASSASSAATSASNASTSETNAASSASSASTSASNAATSETNAATSETNAASSASSAATSASTATTQASAASASATAAANSASAAATSETNAATSATNASTSETNAATSETNAASSATAAASSETNAATSATNASASETNAANSASAASTSATNAATSATNASNSASAASTSATNAATSASAAATSESNASSSASSASTSATNASTSATNAASSATSAAASYDSFDDRYLGTKASDPSTDNDGDSLVTGALYFNTTVGEMRVYSGSSWLAAYIPATGYLQLSGGTMTGALTLNADPSTNLQAATKQYVDTIAAASLHYHDPVRVEKEGNLSATYNNGTAGVGATLTNNSTQAALVIDGVTLSLNDRVLIYEQTNAFENGIYTVTDTGSASTNWVLTRATDADSYAPSDSDSLGEGDAFFVLEGTLGAGELYVMNTSGAITFGTTAINFAQVSSAQVYTGGTGISISGSEISTTALLNVVEDTTPQLGGALSANGFNINMGTYTITDTKVGQWDTAYGWGDHSAAGYATTTNFTSTGIDDNATSTAITIDSSENVGIGATTVDSALHIEKATPRVTLQIAGNSGYNTIESGDVNELIFGRSGTEQMRIDSSGNVGIGTTSPSARFAVEDSNVPLGSNGNILVGSTDTNADTGGQVTFRNTNARRAAIAGRQQGTSTVEGYLQFGTRGSTGDITERMRINSSGNVGIGTANPSSRLHLYNTSGDCELRLTADGSYDPSIRLTGENNGTTEGFTITYDNSVGDTYFKNIFNTTNAFHFDTSTTNDAFLIKTNGDVVASGNVTAYSDERLKSDVKTLDGSKVYEMRGVSFTKDGEDGSGVIAQELQKVAPELVNDSGEYLSVAYGNLVGYLIEAVKDLKAEIEELKNGSSD